MASICDTNFEDDNQEWWCQQINEDEDTFNYGNVEWYNGQEIMLDIEDDANKFNCIEQLEQVETKKDTDEVIKVFTSNMMINTSDEWEEFDVAMNSKNYCLKVGKYVFENIMCFPSSTQLLLNDNIQIADTGSTYCSSGSIRGGYNIRNNSGPPTKDASNKDMQVTKLFDICTMMTDKYGNEDRRLIIKGIQYAKNKPFNLFAINLYTEAGWDLQGNKSIGIRLIKGDNMITFNIPIRMSKGVLWCLNAKRLELNMEMNTEVAFINLSVNIHQAHQMLGHMNEAYTRETAKYLGWEIKRGTLGKCESCVIGKARQKNLGGGDHDNNNAIGYRWHLDISTLKKPEGKSVELRGPFLLNNKLLMMVESLTGAGWCAWFKKKNQFYDFFLTKMNILRAKRGFTFEKLRMDDAGENRDFVKLAQSKD